jgi:putative transcriptional regulator
VITRQWQRASNHEALRLELGRLRADRGLSYDAVADISGLSRTALIDLEHGTTRGSLDTWHRVAHALDVSFPELVGQLCDGHSTKPIHRRVDTSEQSDARSIEQYCSSHGRHPLT